MRIDKVYIENFKNLKKFSIDLDESQMNTVLLGKNATGKSNFIEALILIFKYLDLKQEPPKELQFHYRIEYRVRTYKIIVDFLESAYSFEIFKQSDTDGTVWEKLARPVTKTDFFRNKDLYLPKYVFTYYSGLSDRLDKIFWKHQQNFYNEIKKPNFDRKKLDDLRRLFYVKQIHSFFVLLAFFALPTVENRTKQFLNDVLGIEDLESVLFVLKRPSWRGKGDQRFFGAEGLVSEFLKILWQYSLAPIYYSETVYPDFRSKGVKQDQLYLYITDKKKLNEFALEFFRLSDIQPNNTDLFKALESTYISELLEEVKVKVKKRVDGEVKFKELSEGEQQLLTVIGLLIFTKEEESLVLLDEPDTHLNPLWKYDYLQYLNKYVKNISVDESDPSNIIEDSTTQIIINTHDPLVIGSMDKSQVRMFGKKIIHVPNTEDITEDKFEQLRINGLNQAIEPEKSPRGMGVAGILTSDMFGLPSILDKDTQKKLNRKRYLQGRLMRETLSPEDLEEYKGLKLDLENYGFYEETEDYWFKEYISEMSKDEAFQKVEFTEDERDKLSLRSQEVIQRLLTKRREKL
ncbi:AAA family ATPase [Mucilaginibacter rubeus]|uniref:AAA family ATPase n=1 Tax=Mucilaginibacter rubeus TaxID=2027860 RepID=A0AAE6MLJ0_9SPHI|nr:MULTISPECIES: AAA family ATPase [Mucilaginibacter]QEM07252.1 AAA family ATPase [Mucilaginibacter rubeus]QEM19707.1 AAA family ATPase [Mucilaginibacter gossypii]QTE43595.1 AAA family ATPase [Mucilaginibacter rubeus]QTE50195.1 AAA family ATPase [Mucilaginibacter rubeus]QTE55283.1 AAA family ATPase [Mucilaginibacter rubeus]